MVFATQSSWVKVPFASHEFIMFLKITKKCGMSPKQARTNMTEMLYMDTQGPTWTGQLSQHNNLPVFVNEETGQPVYPGYSYHDDEEVGRVSDDFESMPTIPLSTHPVQGGQNTREGMIAAGKTHSETHFDPRTGIVTEIWDNEVQEGEIRNQSISGSSVPGEVKALPAFRILQGFDHRVPIVRPSAYRKEDPVPDGYNTEAAYYELARQRTENTIRSDNAILNDYRPPQIREVKGVIEPDIRIRPYVPNTSRNLMNRNVMGGNAVYSDAPMQRQHITALSDRMTQQLRTGSAGFGGAEETDSRRYEVYSKMLNDDKSLFGMSSADVRQPTSYSVESVGNSSVTASSIAFNDNLSDAARPQFGRPNIRPLDNTVTQLSQIAPVGNTLVPTLPVQSKQFNKPIDMEVTMVPIIARVTPAQPIQPLPYDPDTIIKSNKYDVTQLAPTAPQWNSHVPRHGRRAIKPNEAINEYIHSQGVGLRQGDSIGTVATGIESSKILRNHDQRGQLVAPMTTSSEVGRTLAMNSYRERSAATARRNQPSTIAL
jgi:hypothetical protein